MASMGSLFAAALIFLALAIIPSCSAHNAVICEDLPLDMCAFAVSSLGQRCVLESAEAGGVHHCKTSYVVVETARGQFWTTAGGYIETDECVAACGLDRQTIGISSDTVVEPEPGFVSKFCSSECYHNCPNAVDLYFNLAAAEGAFLPDLCEAFRFAVTRLLSRRGPSHSRSDT